MEDSVRSYYFFLEALAIRACVLLSQEEQQSITALAEHSHSKQTMDVTREEDKPTQALQIKPQISLHAFSNTITLELKLVLLQLTLNITKKKKVSVPIAHKENNPLLVISPLAHNTIHSLSHQGARIQPDHVI